MEKQDLFEMFREAPDKVAFLKDPSVRNMFGHLDIEWDRCVELWSHGR